MKKNSNCHVFVSSLTGYNISVQPPSKKIITLFVISLSILTFIAVKKFWKGKDPNALVMPSYMTNETVGADQTGSLSYKNKTVADIAMLDSDNDGLPDWQETLAGTNPNNADTDGDGTSDGSEIKLGRNPLARGPDDQKASPFSASTTATTGTDSEPATLSEGIARSLFANTVYLSNNDQMTDENKNALVSDFVNQIANSFSFKEYPANGLSYTSAQDPETIKAYASKFATLQVGMILQMQINVSAIQNDISVMAKIYEKEADDLYRLKVPQEIADTHLQVINNFSKAAAAFRAIVNQKTDPLQVPIAISVYQAAAAEQDTLMLQIAQFIKANGIIFSKDEIGGYWNAFN